MTELMDLSGISNDSMTEAVADALSNGQNSPHRPPIGWNRAVLRDSLCRIASRSAVKLIEPYPTIRNHRHCRRADKLSQHGALIELVWTRLYRPLLPLSGVQPTSLPAW